jgi:hypothetical protein
MYTWCSLLTCVTEKRNELGMQCMQYSVPFPCIFVQTPYLCYNYVHGKKFFTRENNSKKTDFCVFPGNLFWAT